MHTHTQPRPVKISLFQLQAMNTSKKHHHEIVVKEMGSVQRIKAYILLQARWSQHLRVVVTLENELLHGARIRR